MSSENIIKSIKQLVIEKLQAINIQYELQSDNVYSNNFYQRNEINITPKNNQIVYSEAINNSNETLKSDDLQLNEVLEYIDNRKIFTKKKSDSNYDKLLDLAEGAKNNNSKEEYIHYYKKVYNEVVPQLVILNKKSPKEAQFILENYVKSSYKDLIIDDVNRLTLKGLNFTDELSKDIKNSHDIIYNNYLSKKEIFESNKLNLSTLSEKDFIKNEYFTPFLKSNYSKLIVLFKKDFFLAIKTVAYIKNIKLQYSILNKKSSPENYIVIKEKIANLKHNEEFKKIPNLSTFFKTCCYYKKNEDIIANDNINNYQKKISISNNNKLDVHLLYDVLDELKLISFAKKTLNLN